MSSETVKSAKEKTSEAAAATTRPRSTELFERGKKILVGGVNSPVRAFRAVGGTPLVIDHAAGTRLYDVDGREYLDYVCSWGALILGHAHPDVVAAVSDQARRGTSYGMTSPLEIELGEKITRAVPSVEKVRFVSSGTEATMSAVRAGARIYGARPGDQIRGLLPRALGQISFRSGLGPGHAGNCRVPGSAGSVCAADAEHALQRSARVEKLFRQHTGKIAAIIVEPVAANMGVVAPARGISGRAARNHAEAKARC